jgi:glycosyltransferase involved in cell wall biosynthesis
VDLDYFQFQKRAADSHMVLFLGSLDWRPNLDGAQWMLSEIMPLLLKRCPRAKLQIVGRMPPAWLVEAVAKHPAAELRADVPDVRPYLAGAAVMVVPLRVGGGTRLKILEAAAAGVPVVSTTIGAEGLSLVPGEHYLQADTPDAIAAALSRLADDRGLAQRLTERAHSCVAAHYSWTMLAERLDEVWRRCAGSAEQPARLSASAMSGASFSDLSASLAISDDSHPVAPPANA